jgi:hypothetical protein
VRLPKRILVKDQEYIVKRQWAPRVSGKVVDGYCDIKNREIVIAHDVKGQELERVFFHEVFHAICSEIGVQNTKVSPEMEEILVDNFSSWLVLNFDFRKKKNG